MPLPEAPLRAFESGIQNALAGYADLAGMASEWDVAFFPRAWKHPWLGLEVDLPNGRGRIVRCLNHPEGYFMFDVDYPDPVPPINNGKIVLADNTTYYHMTHRYSARELKEMTDGQTAKEETASGGDVGAPPVHHRGVAAVEQPD